MKKFLVGTIIIILFSFKLYAQPGGGGPGGGGDPDAVPIGGLEILLLAGGALGVRNMLKRK
jgi:hypothetical protein